jgi:delta 1-pyrroline-5-carboxylate dehydrogenase
MRTGEYMSIDKLIEVGYQQHAAWKKKAIENRFEILFALTGATWIANPIQKRLEDCLNRLMSFSTPMSPLKGPTGEMNQLVLESRGVFLVSDRLPIEGAWLISSVMALLAGNSIVCHVLKSELALAVQFQTWLRDLDWPYLFQIITVDQYQQGLTCEKVAWVAFWGDEAEAIEMRQILAERQGAIIPFISVEQPIELIWHDFQQPWFLLSLFYEKTISINTTAIGGNTQLLAELSTT